MPTRLFVVHGSHPCATVEKALELKGEPYKIFEFSPPTHAVGMRLMFGPRTVPGIRFADGEKVSGSRAILAELERRIPEPPLLPSDPDDRAKVLEAERWGDEVFQPIARRILWPAFQRSPAAMYSFQEGSKLPKLPAPVIKAFAPGIVFAEKKMNAATEAATRADLQALPGHLDKVDGLIADGVMGGERPNAADLQITPTINLLLTLEDLRPLILGRPCAELTARLFDPLPGRIPVGALPRDWVPAVPAPA